MRVAHVVSHFGLPSEGFVVDVMEELESLGWEAWLITLSVANRSVYRFPPDERLICVSEGGSLRRGVRKVVRSGARRVARKALPRITPAKPSLVHAHFGWSGRLALPLVRRLGVPLVVTFHATDVTVFPRLPGWQRVLTGLDHKYESLFRELDRALVVSRFIESELRALGFDGPTEILPAGVRLNKFPFRGPSLPQSQTRLLYVGRLVPRKGLDVLLRALPRVTAQAADVELEVVGDGPVRAEYQRLAERVAAGRVIFRGARPPADVLEALRRAHILIVPSRTLPSGEAEGSPVVTKEALAVGVPVVATSSGGLPETVPPPYRDELVPEDDPAALAERILAVLQDSTGWAERVTTGRSWVEEQFDSTTLGRRTSELYAEVCRAGG
jgi:colanic acid/amylovoran biosynthesis glycosyltransferase